MKKILAACLLIGFSLGSISCSSRAISYFDDHPVRPVTIMRTSDYVDYIFYEKWTRQYWTCVDKGQRLECIKACDGDNDVKCPAAITYLHLFGPNPL